MAIIPGSRSSWFAPGPRGQMEVTWLALGRIDCALLHEARLAPFPGVNALLSLVSSHSIQHVTPCQVNPRAPAPTLSVFAAQAVACQTRWQAAPQSWHFSATEIGAPRLPLLALPRCHLHATAASLIHGLVHVAPGRLKGI